MVYEALIYSASAGNKERLGTEEIHLNIYIMVFEDREGHLPQRTAHIVTESRVVER
jgi:hypothetical protein